MITATSQLNPAQTSSASILLLPTAVVSVAPPFATLYSGQSVQLSATVSNVIVPGVVWSISPTGVGSLTQNGLFTAPSTISALQTITITATSAGLPGLSATTTITLSPGDGTAVQGGAFAYTFNLLAEILCRRPHSPPVVSAGLNQATTLSCPNGVCSASVTVTGQVLSYALNPGDTLTYAWSLNNGPAPVTFANASAVSTQVSFTTGGVYTLQLAVNDGVSTSSATTVVTVSATSQPGALYITPSASGPNPTNSSVTLNLTFLQLIFGNLDPCPQGAQIDISVTGANPQTAVVSLGANSQATFTYTGANPGTDSVVATAPGTCAFSNFTSNTVPVTWITPVSSLTTSTVTGRFFAADGSGVFNTPATQPPVFTQSFPSIDFNPAAGTVPNNTSNVTNLTRPFTDVVTDASGNYIGTIAAQSANLAAGAGSLYNFSAVFTGTFNIPAAGQLTINITADDAFVFGISGGATSVSGPQTGTPSATAFQNYPVMGGVNQRSPVTTSAITVNFPTAGTFAYELDYAKGGDKNLALVMQTAGIPVPAAALVSLTPSTLPSVTAGQVQALEVVARMANGSALANYPLTVNVTGINQQAQQPTTDGTGQVEFAYAGNPFLTGNDLIQATALVNGVTVYSNVVVAPWNSGTNQAPVVSAGSNQTITLPAPAILNGSVTDDGLPSNTLTIAWSMLSGPGTVAFDDASQGVTAASFSAPGTYVLQLSGFDGALTTNATVTITVSAGAGWNWGWIASPTDGGSVSQPVPVTLVNGITLTGGTLSYYPASNPSAVTVINPSTTGTGPVGTFDPTLLANGSYFIQLSATNSAGVTQNNLAMVHVTGNNKPGRVTATITDLTVPAPGLPIQIQRTYDSLVRGASGDFGFGWNLGVNVQIDVSPQSDVTLTINGQRKTFYFTPPPNPIFTYYYTPQYTAEPGFYGSLVNTGDNCDGVMIRVAQLWQCAINNAGNAYTPSGYVYTDPYGRTYTIGANGSLQSVKDLSGNTITISPTGISSTNGLSVPFVRDTSGRITQITDTLGNNYVYAYDTSGNLASVTYPQSSADQKPAQYGYDPTHLLTQETDQRGNVAGTTTYYPNGQLQSVTDAVGNKTQFAYSTSPSTTTVTNPDGGTQVTVFDSYGMPLTVTDPLGRVTTYTYDANHNQLTMLDPLQKKTTYTYDANGFRTSLTDPLGDVYSAVYNPVGGPTSVTDPLKQVQNVTYDSNFRVSTITDSLGQVAGFTYNAAGLPLTLQDARGNTSSYLYDSYGNRTRYTDPLSRATKTIYDTNGNLSSQIDPRGNTTGYGYDPLNRKTSMTDAYGKVTHYGYDGNNNKTSETDRLGRVTQFAYDAQNRQTQITYPDNTTRSFTYDWRGNKLTETDQLGRVTQYVYDLAGQLTSTTVAFGTADAATTSYTYDLDGRKLTQTDPRGNTTTYGYDDAGRMTSMKDAVGNVTQYGYDFKGQRTSMLDAKSRTTSYTYDARGRQLITTTPDAKTVTKGYDPMGLVTSVTDEENRTTDYSYDAASQLLNVTDALNQITSYTYDPAGNKLTQVDANSHTTSYAWDNLNRRISRTLPAGQSESFTYDFEGNMATRVDFNGKTTTYSYDPLNRLLSRTPDASFTGAAVESFTYTSTGQRASMTDASGTTTYTYSNRDQALTKATPEGTLTYTYDLSGNIASVVSSNAGGTSVAYAWDQDNRVQSVTDNGNGGVTNYSYDATNQVASFGYPNSVAHSYSYDTRDRVTGLSVTNGSSVIASYTQAFSPSGRKQSAAEANGRTPNYSYDPIYRLTNETISGDPTSTNNGSLTYSLDPVGNRLSLTSTLPALQPQSLSYDADDRLVSDSYDANGNTLSSGGTGYTYDFEDRLASTSTGVQIVYDGDGNRVSETSGGVTTQFLVDEQTPTGYAQVAEELVSGAVTAQFTYGPMRISQNRAGTLSYYGYDAGGSTRELINPSGAVTDTYAYDAFGNTVARTGSTVNEFQYRGEQYDAPLALYYLRSRYYVPRSGRFLTADKWESPPMLSAPIWGGSAGSVQGPVRNGYAYANSDPVGYLDESGQDSEEQATILSQVLKLSGTVAREAADIVRYGPFKGEFVRPFIQSTLVILQIMLAKLPEPDEFVEGAVRWDVPGFFRGAEGTWELVIDLTTNTILHFNFTSP